MSDFVAVARVGEIPDPGKKLVEVDGCLLVLCLVGGQYFCLDDVCTHDGGPLVDGRLEGQSIACPRHGARFELATGKAITMPATEGTRCHEVRVEGSQILVRLSDDDA